MAHKRRAFLLAVAVRAAVVLGHEERLVPAEDGERVGEGGPDGAAPPRAPEVLVVGVGAREERGRRVDADRGDEAEGAEEGQREVVGGLETGGEGR